MSGVGGHFTAGYYAYTNYASSNCSGPAEGGNTIEPFNIDVVNCPQITCSGLPILNSCEDLGGGWSRRINMVYDSRECYSCTWDFLYATACT